MPTPFPAPPTPPTIPTGRELYDMLMGHVEPELTTEGMKMLEATYAGETPEQHARRIARYALAFERCENAYREYLETLDVQVDRYRRAAFSHIEFKDRSREEGILDRIASFFRKATT